MSSVKPEPVDAADGGIISQPDSVPEIINEVESQTTREEDEIEGDEMEGGETEGDETEGEEMEEEAKDLINCAAPLLNEVYKSYKTLYQALRDAWTKHPHKPSEGESARALAMVHAELTAWDKRLNPSPKYISYMISRSDFDLMKYTINRIARIIKRAEDETGIEEKLLTKLEQETTNLFNLYRKYGIQWKDVTPLDDSRRVIKHLFAAHAPAPGARREILQLSFIEPTSSQSSKMNAMLRCVEIMIASNNQEEYCQKSRELSAINDSIMDENENAYHDQAYICPPLLTYDALLKGDPSIESFRLSYHLVVLGAKHAVPPLSDVDRQKIRLDALLGTGESYSTKFLEFQVSEQPPPPSIQKPNQSKGRRAKNTYIDSEDESEGETEDEAGSDDDEPPLYTMDRNRYPEGSKTVAWGLAGRSSKWYINRIGPAGAGVYREEDLSINSENDDVDWDNPPRNLCVTNPRNRKGEKRSRDNTLKYTANHLVCIYGVAFKATKNPFPDYPAYEAMNQERYVKENIRRRNGETHEERKALRFIGCHVRVGWLINGKHVKTWELRETFRARWKKTANNIIYEAVKIAEKSHLDWLGGDLKVSSRDPTPAYALDILRNLNGGSNMRPITSPSPTPGRGSPTLGRGSPTPGRGSPTPGRGSPTPSHYSISPPVSSPRVTASPTSLMADGKTAENLAVELEGIKISLLSRYFLKYNVQHEKDLTDGQQNALAANAVTIQRLARWG
jgi:hypothetical protein